MLVEFWDFCRPNSMRTLPYLEAWHERYAPAGLRVIGVHCPGFEPSRDERAVREAVARLGIDYAVLIDSELEVWRDYGNEGCPRATCSTVARGCATITMARAPTRKRSWRYRSSWA